MVSWIIGESKSAPLSAGLPVPAPMFQQAAGSASSAVVSQALNVFALGDLLSRVPAAETSMDPISGRAQALLAKTSKERNGERQVPKSWYEFITRTPMNNDGELDLGLDSSNAQAIKMTPNPPLTWFWLDVAVP